MISLTPYLAEKMAECRQMFFLGSTANDLVEALHDQGLTVGEVCLVIGGVLEIDQAEAHIIVTENPVWVEVLDQSSPVIGDVMQVLDREGCLDVMDGGVLVFHEPLAADIDSACEPNQLAAPR